MATRDQIEATYNYMDEVFRVSLGEHGDLTCALYHGDFSKTLEQAQQDKHDYILDAIHFQSGSQVLDIGCGWGPILKAVKERGGQAIGLTLSTKQAETCTRGGLEAYVKDWKEISVDTFGPYFFTDRDFRYKLEALHGNYNRECFKREIMDHQRMVFEKR